MNIKELSGLQKIMLLVVIFAVVIAVVSLVDAAPPDRTAPPTPVYVELDPGGRVVILCSGINQDHLSIQPASRHGVYVDCVQGDIEP